MGPNQFSLRTLLIVMALIAVGLAGLRLVDNASDLTNTAPLVLFAGACFGGAAGVLLGRPYWCAVMGVFAMLFLIVSTMPPGIYE